MHNFAEKLENLFNIFNTKKQHEFSIIITLSKINTILAHKATQDTITYSCAHQLSI